MSAWYVFAALGPYPTVPTRAELILTSPLFPRAGVHLPVVRPAQSHLGQLGG
jgi:putative alpha-1,2-mannosidase